MSRLGSAPPAAAFGGVFVAGKIREHNNFKRPANGSTRKNDRSRTMSNAREYVITVDRDAIEAQRVAQRSASKLESKETTLIEVVQSLGVFINDEDATTRSKAVNYLAATIIALPSAFLTRQQVEVLCRFFCDRINDGGAILGLNGLSGLSRFSGGMAVITFRAIMKHFLDLQIRPQAQRFQILTLLNGLMSRQREAIKSLGAESLVGITDLVSGEKDPRNLMIIFSVLQVVMSEWDVVGHAETLFDSVFCYFPITFRPPPDDPYGITSQDLKIRLRDCIAASGYSAPYAFPQLIEKLDSSSLNVKKDVLQAISACAQGYGVTTLSNYSIPIWDSLKYEIFNAQEEDIAEEALHALNAVAKGLSFPLNSTGGSKPLAKYIRPITKECNERFREPQHKQARPASQIIESCAQASAAALYLVVKDVVPLLLTLYQDADSIEKRRAILEPLSRVLIPGELTQTSKPSLDAVFSGPLSPFKDRLFEIFSQALMSTSSQELSFRLLALRCLSRACSIPGFLTISEIGMAVQYLDEIVIEGTETDRADLNNAAIVALIEISKQTPSLIIDITFPAFMALLPDSSPDNTSFVYILEGLVRVSQEREISNTLVRRLFSRLDAILLTGQLGYAKAILSALSFTLGQRDLRTDLDLDNHYEKVMALVVRCADATIGKKQLSCLNEMPVVESLGRLACIVVRAVNQHRQQILGQQIYTLFCDEAIFVKIPSALDAPELCRRTVMISTFLIAAIKSNVPLPVTEAQFPVLLDSLVRLSLKENVTAIRHSLLQHVALLINKFASPKTIEWIQRILWAPRTGLLDKSNVNRRSIRVGFWISKALILRLVNVDQVVSRLLDLLTLEELGGEVARGFQLLLASDEIISKENGATIRLLARQKTFHAAVPAIAKAFRDAEPPKKPNYLVALSGVLKYIDVSILALETPTLLPLLLQSLDLEQQEVKAASIETLAVLANEDPSSIGGHISSIISRLLSAAAGSNSSSQRVRYHSLCCLRGFPGKMDDSKLLPYRRAVCRGMLVVLDDPKRNIRKEAVNCRAAWLDLDEPDEDE